MAEDKIKFLAAVAWINRKLKERDKQFINNKYLIQTEDTDRIVVLLDKDINELDITNNLKTVSIRFNKEEYCFSAEWEIGQPLLVLNLNEESFVFQVDTELCGYTLTHSGIRLDIRILSLLEPILYKFMPDKVLPDQSK